MRSQKFELQQSVDGINQEIDEVKKSQSGGKDKILTASRLKVQSEVSEILRENETEISGKFELVQDKIQSLSNLGENGQGNQGIQQQVEDIK